MASEVSPGTPPSVTTPSAAPAHTANPHPAQHVGQHLGQKKQTYKFLLTTFIVALVVACLALGLAWRQGVFEGKLAYHFATASGDNLSRGMAVQFKGFKIGYLNTLELQRDGSISGQVIIQQKHSGFVTQGSALRLSKDKIVTSELVLIPGPAGAALLPNGSELALKTDGGMDALEKRLLDRVDPVLIELTALVKRLSDPEHGVPPAVEALRLSLIKAGTTLQQVNTTLTTANKMLGDVDGRIKDPKIDSILANAEQTLAGLKANTEQLNTTLQNSQQLMGKGQQLMGTGEQLLGTGQKSLQSTNAELAKTLEATQRVLSEAVGMMEDMRGSTLGRFLVGPRKGASAPVPAPGSVPEQRQQPAPYGGP